MALNPKRAAFCREYMIDRNATQAAIRAGYSEKSARSVGQRMLTFADVQNEIARLTEQQSRRSEVDAAWVLGRLRIEATRRGKGSSHSARVKAIELLGRHLGMKFPEFTSQEHTGTVSHEHSGTIDVIGEIERLGPACEDVADRSSAASPDGDGAKKSLDS